MMVRWSYSVAIHLEIRKKYFMKNCQSHGTFKEKFYCFTNVLLYVDSTCFISLLCQRIRVINVTFCYTADKMESGKNIASQGKANIMATLS